jgi:hypothetical protein
MVSHGFELHPNDDLDTVPPSSSPSSSVNAHPQSSQGSTPSAITDQTSNLKSKSRKLRGKAKVEVKEETAEDEDNEAEASSAVGDGEEDLEGEDEIDIDAKVASKKYSLFLTVKHELNYFQC